MANNTNESILKISDLYKDYGKGKKVVHALNGLDFEINEDEIIGLIGANGSGKTTLFSCIIGTEDIKSGSIEVLGGNPWTDMNVRKQIIFSSGIFSEKNYNSLNLIKHFSYIYENFDKEFAVKLIELFGINVKAKYSTLSTGMASIVRFSLAMASRSKVTLLDEPFTGVDIEKRKLMYDILLRDYMENPRVFIVSSHNLTEIENILARMVFIDEGKLIFNKSMDEVRELLIDVSGDKDKLSEFANSIENAAVIKHISQETGNHLIVNTEVDETAFSKAKDMGLDVNKVDPEDLCVYMTEHTSDEDLEKLWA
ncbi:MAG: ABC transporter ATP-binding protein [Lachnospiraceae bacterium]|nr:ABC transporter ATP-binding protein [Lachnospiraceae bacterium]